MNEKLRNKLFVMTSILCIIVILLPIWTGLGVVVYAMATGPGTIEPGTGWEVPETFEQYGATDERYDGITWSYSQGQVNALWREQGCKSERGWAYVKIAGKKRYLIALSQEFGWSGDYVDVTVKNSDGTKTTWQCLLGDSKGNNEAEPMGIPIGNINRGAFLDSSGFQWGHLHPTKDNCCNVLELLRVGDYTDEFKSLLAELRVVTGIQNGGSYFDHPDGPIGLDGSYGSSGGIMGELASLIGSVGAFFRDCWVLICTAFDNVTNGREDSSIFIYRYGVDDGNVSSTVTGTNGDIIEACKLVTETFMSRNARYSLDEGLISGDIEKCYKEATRACCATYVSMVLYVSGRVKPEVINKYGYHATWNMAAMLTEAGAKRVYYPDIQPGDVVVHWPGNKGHVLIYAGDNQCWDQRSCCISTDGTVAATGTTVTKDAQYLSDSEIWRLP